MSRPSTLRLQDLPDILTPDEVAAVMRVDIQVVHRQIKAGLLPSVRFGRWARVPKERLLRLLEGGEA